MKGATVGLGTESQVYSHFNPRTCERCDLAEGTNWASKAYFNPRTCERCDDAASVPDGIIVISIHAPVKGAT